MKISLCMIIKDEEKYIKQCLDNALPLVDEAIVVDTGSTDDTINIIEKSYKDKVKLIKHPWKNDFSEARNKSLENANGDWILILDADEKLIFDREKLIEQINKESVDGYNIPMYNFLGIDNILYSAVMPRLLKNDNLKYIRAIHEQITLNGEPLKSLSTFETSVCKIIHYGYLQETVIKKNKTERNITIIKDELEKNPEDGFQWYNLGITYMGENKYSKAIDAFIESNKYSQKGRRTYHDSLVLNLAECLYREKSYKQLRNYLDALKEDNSIKRYPDYYYYYGKVFEKNKKYIKAIESYNKAIDIGEINNSISKKGIGSFISNIEIARILAKQKKVNDAVMKYIEAIFYPDNFTYKGLEELKELLTKENMQEVLVELVKMIDEKNKKSEEKEKNNLVTAKGIIKTIEDQEENKKQVKEEIQSLLEQGLLEDAKELLKQYENIVSDDIDVYSIKGVIAIMEGDIDEAESVLKEGLEVNPINFDILYNLAYLYEIKNYYENAFKFYRTAEKYLPESQNKTEIKSTIERVSRLGNLKSIEIKNIVQPKVTVIIPSYNQKNYLKQTIKSCLEQDYGALEILVVDDCSTDGTHYMMKQYKDIKNIRYIRNEVNLGAGNNTYNLIYKYTNSEYAIFLNHDDYFIKKDYISKAVELLVSYPNLSFVWANCKIKNEDSGEISFTKLENRKITNGIEYFKNYETIEYPHITGLLTTVFDVKKLKAMGFGNEKTKSKDTFMYLKLMLTGDVGFIKECSAVYRVHKKSLSFNMPVEYDQSTILEFEKIKEYALVIKNMDKMEIEVWINNRVFAYVMWRFKVLWNNKDKKNAIQLLISISEKYPDVYNKILESI